MTAPTLPEVFTGRGACQCVRDSVGSAWPEQVLACKCHWGRLISELVALAYSDRPDRQILAATGFLGRVERLAYWCRRDLLRVAWHASPNGTTMEQIGALFGLKRQRASAVYHEEPRP